MLEVVTSDRVIKRRRRLDPKPRFKATRHTQLDAVVGCPELQVPASHLARKVREFCEALDTSALEQGYSSLGRRGYHPRTLLATWLYASMIGVHFATQVAKLTATDAAFRLLTGGHTLSEATLKRFRLRHGAFFEAAITQTVRMAEERGLLDTSELAVDSMRLRAEASMKALRTRARSTKRLAALSAVDLATLDDDALARHQRSIEKHTEALQLCDERGTASVLLTNDSAGFMKFPHGGAQPGHRLTALVAGSKLRLFVSVLVDASPTDHGKLVPVVDKARRVLADAGLPPTTPLHISADAGYWEAESLTYALQAPPEVEILIAEAKPAIASTRKGFFPRELFVPNDDGRLVCPAGRVMRRDSKGRKTLNWYGRDCGSCGLKSQCTDAPTRTVTITKALAAPAAAMRGKLAKPDAKARYGRRLPTVEPAFASLEDAMAFRRASSRHAKTIPAEVYLNVLAHNALRLIAARRLRRLFVCLVDF